MNLLTNLQEINEKYDSQGLFLKLFEGFIHLNKQLSSKAAQVLINHTREETDKILSMGRVINIYSNNKGIDKGCEINQEDLTTVGKISDRGMGKHLLSHYFLYQLRKSGIYLKENRLDIVETEISILHDKMLLEYDLYLSFLAGIKLNDEYFNIDFIEKNTHIIWLYFDDLTERLSGEEKMELKIIVQRNLENFLGKDRKSEQKDLIQSLKLADLLGLIDIGMYKDFYICGSMFQKIGMTEEGALSAKKPGFMLDIIKDVFGSNKTMKITKENYGEMKEKFQLARKKYLDDMGVQDISNQKEISEKLQIKYGFK